MADIFFSYARVDSEEVRRVYDQMQTRDRDVWVDWEGIPPTAEFMAEIYAGIEGAQSFVFFLSPASIASEVCRLELAHAEGHNKRLLPVVVGDVAASDVPDSLAKLNWIFARNTDDAAGAADTLVEAQDTDLGWVRTHTRLLTRAIEWDAHERHGSFVLRGRDLEAAETWLEGAEEHDPAPTSLQTAYIVASRAVAVRRQRQLLSGVAVALIVAVTLAIVALDQRNRAEQRSRIALARQLGAEALAAARAWPQRSNLLAVESIAATRRSDGFRVAGAEEALRRTLSATGGRPLDALGEEVHDVVFSADGQWLAGGGDDGLLLVWEAAQPDLAPHVLDGHPESVLDLAFSPDGQWLASAGGDGSVWLWTTSEWDNGRELEVSRAPVRLVRFDPGSRWLAAAAGNELWLLDLATPGVAPIRLSGSRSALVALAFSPDSASVAAGNEGRLVLVWQLSTPDDGPVRLEGNAGMTQALAFHPDGRFLATAGSRGNSVGPPREGGVVRLWDLDDPAAGPRALRAHHDFISTLAFSADGQWLATAGWDRTARLWAMRDLEAPSRLLAGHTGLIRGVAFDSSGRLLATASEDRTARLWNLLAPEQAPVVLAGHESAVRRVTFSADGRWLATAADEPWPRVWRVDNPASEPEVLRGHDRDVLSVLYLPDGRLASGGADATLRIWSAPGAGGRVVVHAAGGPVWSLTASADGQWLAAGAGTREQLWRLAPTLAGPESRPVHRRPVKSVSFSPDGGTLVSGWAGLVQAIVTGSRQGKAETLATLPDEVTAIAHSPDGSWLAAAASKSVRLLPLVAGVEPLVLDAHEDDVLALAFTPNGRMLASASADHTVRLWDLAVPDREPRVLRGYEAAVNAVAVSPRGRWLAAGGDDRTIRLWSLKDLDSESVTLRGHLGPVTSLAFDPAGERLSSASADGTVRVWRTSLDELLVLACRRAGRRLTETEWRAHLGELPYRPACSGPTRR